MKDAVFRRGEFKCGCLCENGWCNYWIIVALFGLFSATPVLLFSGETGTVSAVFLREDPSAREFSMGRVSLPLVNSPGAAYLNPAALGHMTGHHVELSVWRGLDAVSQYSFAGVVLNTQKVGVFSINYLGYDSGKEDVYDLNGNHEKVTLQRDYAVSTGWGKSLGDFFFIGGQVKQVESELAGIYSASALTFDAGVMCKSVDDRMTIGLAAQNISGNLKYKTVSDPLPRAVTGEVGYRWPLYGGSLTAGLSAQKYLDSNSIDRGIGVEYSVPGIPVFLRGGLRGINNETIPVAGIGVLLGDVALDYGFSAVTQLASPSQRFSLVISFGPNGNPNKSPVKIKGDTSVGRKSPGQDSEVILTNKTIIKFVREGLSDAVIISMIRKSPNDFSLSPLSMGKLKAAGVSQQVRNAMKDKWGK